MKILHVAESIRGGCGTYLNELVPMLMEDLGADGVRVIAPDRHAAQLPRVARGIIRTFRRPGRVLGLFFLAPKLMATVREFRPDLIHAHSTFAGAVVRLLSIFSPHFPPIVYCPHGWVFDTARSAKTRSVLQAAERLLSHFSAAIVSISDAERQAGEAAGIQRHKMTVIYNGLRAEPPAGTAAQWETPAIKVLFVGRLDRQKGVDVLIEAARTLEDTLNVRIVGEAVVRKGAKPEDSQNISYLGWLDEEGITAQMRACDLVAMPSRWEGFGLVALEAMRLGKQVIASSVGGLKEVVIDGVTGRLVAPDDPKALRAALLRDSPQERMRMGQAGRKRFLVCYNADRTHAQLKSLYRAVIQLPSPATPIERSH